MGGFFITQNLSNNDRYCIEVCKAKCCYTFVGGKCPNLAADHKCSIYHLWQNNTCHYTGHGLKTTSIEYAIEHKLLRPEVAVGCCYVRPELIKEAFGSDTNEATICSGLNTELLEVFNGRT